MNIYIRNDFYDHNMLEITCWAITAGGDSWSVQLKFRNYSFGKVSLFNALCIQIDYISKEKEYIIFKEKKKDREA